MQLPIIRSMSKRRRRPHRVVAILVIVVSVCTCTMLVHSHIPSNSIPGESSNDGKVLGYEKFLSLSREIFNTLLNNPPTVVTYNNGWITDENVCKHFSEINNAKKKDLQLHFLNGGNGKLQIFTHNPNNDVISRWLSKTWGFEPKTDAIIRAFLNFYRKAVFIDIGANIGVKSLQVLSLERRVIAIEALDTNIERICLSTSLNGLNNNITIINNAISNKHGRPLTLAVGSKGDLSMNFIQEADDILTKLKKRADGINFYKAHTKNVHTVTLNDILDLSVIKQEKQLQCFIKLDVEGYEDIVFQGGDIFFRHAKVVGMILEWRWHKNRKSAIYILEFLYKYNMVPYDYSGKELNTTEHSFWPHDILIVSKDIESELPKVLKMNK